MGKTKRNSDYKNFVDSDKNNLMVIKPKKFVEQIRTFEGEEDFVVQRNNNYIDRGLIVQTNDNPNSTIDVVGISDSSFANATNAPTTCPTYYFNWGASVVPNSATQFVVSVNAVGGQAPYTATINYTRNTDSNSITIPLGMSGSGASQPITGFSNPTTGGINGGTYTISVSVSDANNCTGTPNTPNTQAIVLQGTSGASSVTPISGLTASATLQGNNNIKCDAIWSNGTAPYSVKYSLYKVAMIGGSTTLQGSPIVQSPTSTIDSYTAQNLADGKYKFVVEVTDANNNTLSSTTSTITILSQVSSGGTFVSNVTSNPLSSLTTTATLVSGNNIQCDANWSNGTAPYSVKYTLTKISLIGVPSVIGSPTIQNPSNTNDSFTAQNLADGKYKFEVVVTDSNNDTLTATSQIITIISNVNVNVNVNPNPALSNLNVNATLVANDDIQCDATWSNGLAPFSLKYFFYKDGVLISTTPRTTSTQNDSLTLPTNSNAGNYKYSVEVTDANNVTKTESSPIITITAQQVFLPILFLGGLTATATLVGTNDLKCDVSWTNGNPPLSITFYLYKDGTLLSPIPPQTSNSNSTTYTATNLADGNYQYKVVVSDSQGSVSGLTQLINITNPTSSSGSNTGGSTGGGTTGGGTTGGTTSGTTSGSTILSGGGGGIIEKPVYLERETIIEAETFYSKNKFPIWLLIAIGVYFVATNNKK